MTMQVIQHIELSSASSTIDFTNIPQNFTDLSVALSLRSSSAPSSSAINDGGITFNGSNSNKSGRLLYGQGSAAASATYTDLYIWYPTSLATANTFGNISITIPNYANGNVKSTSHDIVTENNATFSYTMIFAGLWNSTAAITSLQIYANGTTFVAGSSATLYGILKGSDGTTTVS